MKRAKPNPEEQLHNPDIRPNQTVGEIVAQHPRLRFRLEQPGCANLNIN